MSMQCIVTEWPLLTHKMCSVPYHIPGYFGREVCLADVPAYYQTKACQNFRHTYA